MLDRLLALVVDVKREERRALLWSFAYFFLILSAYSVLRPLRDNAGITGGTRALPLAATTATFFRDAGGRAALWLAGGAAAAQNTDPAGLPLLRRQPGDLLAAADLSALAQQVVLQVFFVWITVFSIFAVLFLVAISPTCIGVATRASGSTASSRAGGSLGRAGGPPPQRGRWSNRQDR